MKGLKKAEQKRKDGIATDLQSRFEELTEACEAYNANDGNKTGQNAKKKKLQLKSVEQAIVAYNEALSTARSFCEETAAEIQEFIDGKSEKWQESEKANEYIFWKEAYEEFEQTFEDINLNDIKDYTGDLDTSSIENAGEALSQIADEVGS